MSVGPTLPPGIAGITSTADSKRNIGWGDSADASASSGWTTIGAPDWVDVHRFGADYEE